MFKKDDVALIFSIIITLSLYFLGLILDNSVLIFIQGFSTAIVIDIIIQKIRNIRCSKVT